MSVALHSRLISGRTIYFIDRPFYVRQRMHQKGTNPEAITLLSCTASRWVKYEFLFEVGQAPQRFLHGTHVVCHFSPGNRWMATGVLVRSTCLP